MGTTYSENAISGTRDTVDPKYLEAMERLENLKNGYEKPPSGAFTRQDACALWGVSMQPAVEKLNRLVTGGKLEAKKYRVETGAPAWHYWFKE